MRLRSLIIMITLLFALAGSGFAGWEKANPKDIADQGDQRSLLLMIDRQVKYLEPLPDRKIRLGGMHVTRKRLLKTARALRLLVLEHHGKPEFQSLLREKFDIYKASKPGKDSKALFTGYYDPTIDVSRVPTPRFRFPIYGKPKDLRCSGGNRCYRLENGKRLPYYTRRQIDKQKVLAGKNIEIGWVDDYVSLYYLMVQGSGTARFSDGKTATIHFASSNGYPYKSASRACMNDGKCPGGYERNLAWFRANIDLAMEYFYTNQRYIFFRMDNRLPRGVQNVPLTAMRTIATDKSQYPAGAIALVKIPMPYQTKEKETRHQVTTLFVGDGDTGSAIKGPGRADFYYGSGEKAGRLAGSTYGLGEIYYFIIK